MISWWNIYLIIASSAMGFALVYTPLCKIIALKTGFIDQPAEQQHKGHKAPTPLLGGLATCLAMISTVIFGLVAAKSMHKDVISPVVMDSLPGVTSVSTRMIVIGVGALLATFLGMYDDRFNMSAKAKFGGQFVIAAIAVTWGGANVSAFIHNAFLTWCLSVFWIILMINALNFFDNMDGLAVGIATIAFSFFTIAAGMRGQYFVATFGAVAAGTSLGFWFYNHSPASIFMGDSGSHLLGYMLAIMGCMITYYKTDTDTPFSILIPVFILALPLFDLVAVSVIRWRIGKPFYIGDHNHISHRFLKMGMSRKMAVLLVHLLALIIGMCVLPLLWGVERTTVVSLIPAVTILLMVSLLQYSGKKTSV
jgi:UDP-GlcNAc:undecaprenyl-phosphate GlcNAc-1-phosphate transferase